MENNNQKVSEESQELAVRYMSTLIATARESFLILNTDLRVISANPVFYQNFQVSPEETENKLLYDLGNGQWNIPELKKLLEEILPQKKVVKDYVVTHIFETIGKKTIILNAQKIGSVQLIIFAMEDITVRTELKEKLALKAEDDETTILKGLKTLVEKNKELESLNQSMIGRELKMVELKKEIEALRQAQGKN